MLSFKHWEDAEFLNASRFSRIITEKMTIKRNLLKLLYRPDMAPHQYYVKAQWTPMGTVLVD